MVPYMNKMGLVKMSKKKKEHKRTPIKPNVKNMLWLRAAGRCEFRGCNKRLWLDDLTKNPCNQANIAHIVSDSPEGPRGDVVRSPLLAGDIENLMLLCRDHHGLIDSMDYVLDYPEELLLRMKKDHELRMERVAGIKDEMGAHTVACSVAIEDTLPPLDANMLNRALLPDYYPVEERPIEIGWTYFKEGDWNKYWKDEELKLVTQCRNRILDQIGLWPNKRIALFAMGPMPLLVKLGTILNDKIPVEVYQKHRNPDTWAWQDGGPVDYIVNAPQDYSKDPVLVFSLSYDITDRVKKHYGEGASVWDFRIDSPNNDFLRSKSQLEEFSKKVYEVLANIKLKTQKERVKVFMSMPVACAVELGRVWMKKADVALDLYDYNTKYSEKDEYALTIR